MAKLSLSPISSRYASVAALNANFDAIETALENTLSRDGTTPNELSADLDANNQSILNLRDATSANEAVPYGQLTDLLTAYAGDTFISQRQSFVATNNQTVFNFTTLTYVKGINNLNVYVNGSKQIVNVNYVETSPTSITFVSGLNNGDVVECLSNQPTTTIDGGDAATVQYVPAGGSAVTTTVQTKLRESVSVKDFGAVGDGVTDDSASFSNFESAYKGALVDLLGLTYLVTTFPTEANYFNGTFRVSTTNYVMPRTPLSHPLDGAALAIMENTDSHYWPGAAGQPTNDDVILMTYVNSWRHTASVGGQLMCAVSYDGGVTLSDHRNVYENSSYEPRGLVGGMVTGTRFGVFFVIVDSAGTIQGTRFAYTDDNSATWSTATVATTNAYPHGEFVTDDSGGLNVFGYGGTNIYRWRSTDNGATWAQTLVKAADATFAQPVEPAVVKVAAGKYLMFCRNDAGGDMCASTSADCATWTAWADTNIPLGLNPPSALFALGKVWLYLSARRSTAINAWEDKLLVAELDGAALYAAGGAISGTTPLRVAMAGKTAMIGYLTFCQLRDGRYLGYMIDGETVLGSTVPTTSRVVRLGGHTPVIAAPALLLNRRTAPPITHNSMFSHWTRGTSFTGITTTTPVADRWLAARTGTNIDVTQVESSDAVRKILGSNSRYGLRLQGDVSGSGRILMQRFYQKDRIVPMLDRVVTVNALVGGTYPGYFYGRVIVNFGSGGSATVYVDANTSQRSVVGDLTLLTATLYTPNADGATWGTDPYMQFNLTSNDAGVADARIYAVWYDYGDSYIPLDPQDFDNDRAVLDQYCQKLTYGQYDVVGLGQGLGTANVPVFFPFPTKMVAQPALSSPDPASNLRIGSTALTSIGYSLISPQAAQLDTVMSAGTVTSGDVAVCSVASAGGWSLIADVGY